MRSFGRFGEYYDLIYREIVDYEKECGVLERLFARFSRKTVETVLDVGCGTGSHALILSRRGYGVTGIDISETMIAVAKRKAENERSEADFLVQDMRNLRLDKTFDCAICMFGGFGYVLTHRDLVSLFTGLSRHLVREGLFIFEFWNVGGLKQSPYKSWVKSQDENLTLYRLSESNFDPQTNVLNIDMHFLVIREGRLAETFTEAHKLRCYTLAEIRQDLESNGFELLDSYDWDVKEMTELQAPRKETFRILAVSKNKA